ncbi:sensor histidine kinase [Priestia flexa]|uniref:sensor histidine kinase n=1 Tax=Priestia flexa TaxID=86664 RepID=UPI00099C55A1|nr:HAMP domain-containing sensor histidine kinase [Priestia flexa]AQX55095.1 two-component sensor histidine kinase [Priestia flexa]WEZ07389.1 HAMP domain-containing sensor histidine kinase [Priestia flexa]
MKSIYLKLVLSFIITIVLSVIITITITTLLSKDRLGDKLEPDMFRMGEEFIQLYGANGSDEAARFLSNTSFIHFSFIIVDSEYNRRVLGDRGPTLPIDKSVVDNVLQGDRFSTVESEPSNKPKPNIVGIPFIENNQKYALFVQSHPQRQISVIQDVQLIQLISVLFIGIILFAYVSTILIKPIQRLSGAMKKVGKGDYSVQVEHASSDEIGLLTKNFNQMAKELNKIETMRQEFIASVSHEIQSPLTSIKGFSKALKDNIVSEDKKQQYLTIIEKESTRLSQLSSNLLKLASLDAEHHPFHHKTYDLDEQIRHVILALEPQWTEKELEIELDLERVRIEGDEELLEQVWLNLLSNSIKYTHQSGTIEVSMSSVKEGVTVSVKDTGIGIDEEDQKYIFESFYTVDKSRSLKSNGLGLAISKKIVNLHEGSISVESRINKGSTFTVFLPDKKSQST